jgi:hypothetical protein
MSDGDDVSGGLRLHDAPQRRLVHVGAQLCDGVLPDVPVLKRRDVGGDEVSLELPPFRCVLRQFATAAARKAKQPAASKLDGTSVRCQ